MRYVICGVDIGRNSALAIIDLNRNLIKLKSFKDSGLSNLIKEIDESGEALIIATDVNPIPRKIKKLAAALQCNIFYPSERLTINQKIKITRELSNEIKNIHERDALAAAIKAYKRYSNLFIRIKNAVGESNENYEKAIYDLIKRKSPNIKSYIETMK